MSQLIEVELTQKQVDLLFPALKQAESAYTDEGNFKACKALTEIYNSLHRQIYTYGQLEE
jgi:hypothetical protein